MVMRVGSALGLAGTLGLMAYIPLAVAGAVVANPHDMVHMGDAEIVIGATIMAVLTAIAFLFALMGAVAQ